MGGYGSISGVRPLAVNLGKDLAPIAAGLDWSFTGQADGRAVQAEPDGARLVLSPGVYQLTLCGGVKLGYERAVELRAVVAGDVRFKGPTVRVEHSLAREVRAELGRLEIPTALRGRGRESEPVAVTRAFCAAKLVTIPAGPAVPVEVWGRAEGGDAEYGGAEVVLENLELIVTAVAVGGAP